MADKKISIIAPYAHNAFAPRSLKQITTGPKQKRKANSALIFHGNADTEKSSAYAAYESPTLNNVNIKHTEMTFFVTTRI